MTTDQLIARLKALPRRTMRRTIVRGLHDFVAVIDADDLDALIAEAEGKDKCPKCKGSGKELLSIIGMGSDIHKCPVCKGTGKKP